VKALKVCARAERESQDRQNKYFHHLGVINGHCLIGRAPAPGISLSQYDVI
jgi:hypothetical protein